MKPFVFVVLVWCDSDEAIAGGGTARTSTRCRRGSRSRSSRAHNAKGAVAVFAAPPSGSYRLCMALVVTVGERVWRVFERYVELPFVPVEGLTLDLGDGDSFTLRGLSYVLSAGHFVAMDSALPEDVEHYRRLGFVERRNAANERRARKGGHRVTPLS